MPPEQYERIWKDYYEILQVHPRAESEVISAAYRKLAFIYHPDRNRNSDAGERLKLINEAHEVLLDPGRRALYDQFFQAKGQAGSTSANNNSSGYQNTWQEEQEEPDPDPWEETDASSAASSETPRQQTYGTDASAVWGQIMVWLAPRQGDPAGILPWPSWQAQRALLIATVPAGLLILAAAAMSASFPVAALAAMMTGAAVYAGIQTRWLRQVHEAPTPAKVAGGTTIAVSGVTAVLAAVSLVVAVVVTILMLFLACAFARAQAEKAAKSK